MYPRCIQADDDCKGVHRYNPLTCAGKERSDAQTCPPPEVACTKGQQGEQYIDCEGRQTIVMQQYIDCTGGYTIVMQQYIDCTGGYAIVLVAVYRL